MRVECFLALLMLVGAANGDPPNRVRADYIVLVPDSKLAKPLAVGLPPVPNYQGQQVATRYSLTVNGTEVVVAIPRDVLSPALEISGVLPLRVTPSACLEARPVSKYKVTIESAYACRDKQVSLFLDLAIGDETVRLSLEKERVGEVFEDDVP